MARRDLLLLISGLLVGAGRWPVQASAKAVPPDPAWTAPFTVEELIRRVAKAQRAADDGILSYTFDERYVEISWDKKGRPKDVETRVYYHLSGENGEEGTRALAFVDGRPATEEEKRKAAEDDAKGRKQRMERRAAERAKSPPKPRGDDEDPMVGARRLSELIGKYDYRFLGEDVVEGRPVYLLEFEPKAGLSASSLSERALNALAGRVTVDAVDFQILAVEARLTTGVKVGGGIAANVKQATISYAAQRLTPTRWFPCVVDVRLQGKTALFFRLDTSVRFELSNYRTFAVDTESRVEREGEAPAAEPPTPPPAGGAFLESRR